MANGEYEIKLYRPEYLPQIVNLLQYLWGADPESNLSYFKWKYVNNPYTEFPLGIVALHKGHVVGFRGYFATRCEILKKNNNIIVLCPGDTCVHPDHQRKGLSVAMGNMATKEYAQKYKILLNFTSTKNSLPGYQKLGFLPLSKKVYMTRYSLLGLIKYILAAHKALPLKTGKVIFGQFDSILVSDSPKPKEMSSLAARQNREGRKIRLFQDEDFFRWRFSNPRNKYVFYYTIKNGVTSGYVVVGVSPNNQRGYLLDYADSDGVSIEEILRYMIKMRHFDILSIYNFCLDDSLSQSLKGLGFKINSLVRIIEKRLNGELPLLIRPVKRTYAESDFFIEALDMRKIENWSIKAIFSDDA